ncbi:glycosyltransferase family 1 protein [Mycobacterium sp. PS03-16]|uniref:glycosyltransferase family 4 protein n=1 Tax=Mycobacterium sp. PS03-16 TaxID=2559611 RepID=UPI00107423A8|nr:glycosyltransferase family 4 protein [Mycobacterium sp. PS03-16]TFV58738.1 glycosyltransferase family 1 protein [Mycobacterium sp. PS03-16]
MTGAEWFASGAGGLNRYFSDLYTTLATRTDVEVTAASFGAPESGGHSWGAARGSTLRRVRAAGTHGWAIPPGTVIDRHFCLYGRPAWGPVHRHPLVVHFHGPWAAEALAVGHGRLNAHAKYLVERLRYQGADRYVVLSRHFRDLLAERYRVPHDRIEIIAPGVDLARFRAAEQPGEQRPTVLCVRRLVPRMGIDVLLEAWRGVSAQMPDARLVIVGSGPSEPALRAQARHGNLCGSVQFAGQVGDDQLADLYRSATLTVVPTLELEGFGLAALESLAAGRAPVVTDCGGLPESVEDLDDSLIVPAGDAEALADRLLGALWGRRPDARACRRHAERFTWAAAADRHVRLYAELAAAGRYR